MLIKLLTYPYIPCFRGILYAGFANRVLIRKPLLMTPQYISFGHRVVIQKNCRIEGIAVYEDVKYQPRIVLGDHVTIQQNLHLTCAQSVIIGKNTAIAANVTITDIHHPYDDINIPIERQRIKVNPVRIGADCKIYNNAVILPGVTIGDHVTVAANTVVVHDIPDYSVVAGIPGRVIKRYSFSSQQWEKVEE